jgi:hypothetical protein
LKEERPGFILINSMGATLSETTSAAIGYSSLSDAFQCGREAAQMAKSQLREGPLGLVLVFGPDSFHFQNYIEGVRLVSGEDTLVGIAAHQLFSSESTTANTPLVFMLQSGQMCLSLASAEVEPTNLLPSLTSLFTQFRNHRGTIRQQFDHHGLILLSNSAATKEPESSLRAAADAGLGAWMASLAPRNQSTPPLLSQDTAIKQGFVGIECLSRSAWGIGEVNIGMFKNHPNVYQEATKSAVRNALSHMEMEAPAFGFLLFNFPLDSLTAENEQEIVAAVKPLVGEIPLIGFSTTFQYVRSENNWPASVESNSVVALLGPE